MLLGRDGQPTDHQPDRAGGKVYKRSRLAEIPEHAGSLGGFFGINLIRAHAHRSHFLRSFSFTQLHSASSNLCVPPIGLIPAASV